MPKNQVVLDQLVDVFVDKISETFLSRKYFTSIYKPRTGNIHLTFKKERGQSNTKQEKLLFAVVNENPQLISKILRQKSVYVCSIYHP